MSIFKELKQGNTVFILNRDTMKVEKGNATNVSPSHAQTNPNMTLQQVVDITVNIDGKPKVFVVPDGASVTYSGNLTISCDKDCILNEVKSVKAQCEQTLGSINDLRERLKACNDTISDLDDVYREKQENDARLSKLETMMQTLLDKLA